LYHSTLGSRVIKKKKRDRTSVADGVDVLIVERLPRLGVGLVREWATYGVISGPL